ncbi:hypothetical protein ATCC90586_002206 [Pythium insidiosum]|nr:hypothetical protein ATCC90586_002206 [Pythium insidiosum]
MTATSAAKIAPGLPLLDAAGPRRRTRVFFYATALQYRCAWWGIVTVYFWVWFFLFAQAVLYAISYARPKTAYFTTTYQTMSGDAFAFVAAVYFVMCVFFLSSLFKIVHLSLTRRRLCLDDDDDVHPNQELGRLKSKTGCCCWRRKAKASSRTARRGAIRSSNRGMIQRMKSFTSVQGDGFELLVIGRTLIQISVQSLLAYESSRYTTNVALNVTYGVLILVNCFSMPIVRLVFRTNLATERLVLLVADLFVDSVLLLIPMVLWVPYFSASVSSELVMFTDTYNAKALMELRIVLVTSYFNLFVKFVPSISVYLTTLSIRELLRRQAILVSTVSSAAGSEKTSTLPKQDVPFTALDQLPIEEPPRSAPSSPPLVHGLHTKSYLGQIGRSSSRALIPARQAQFVERWFSRLFVAWGIALAVVYILALALRGPCEPGCELVLTTWFTANECRCAVVHIDCHTRQIDGRAHELTAIFARLTRTGLTTLILTHCAALEVPASIHWFRDLFALDIYNASIVSFDEQAEISRAHYRRMGWLYLTRTNVTAIPPALLGGDLPPTLREIGIIVSQLRELPSDLHVKWPSVRTAYFEHAQLAEFPDALGRMTGLESISLYNNRIARIPNAAFASSKINYLVLNHNPISALPARMGDTSELFEVQFQFTNVSLVSSEWVESNRIPAFTNLFGLGSPVCGDASGDDDVRAIGRGVVVRCRPRFGVYNGVRSYTYYPLEGKTLERDARHAN